MIFFVIVAVLLLLMLIGVPVAISMGMTAIASLIFQGKAGVLTMAAQRMFSGATGFYVVGRTLLYPGGSAHEYQWDYRANFQICQGDLRPLVGGIGSG